VLYAIVIGLGPSPGTDAGVNLDAVCGLVMVVTVIAGENVFATVTFAVHSLDSRPFGDSARVRDALNPGGVGGRVTANADRQVRRRMRMVFMVCFIVG